MKKEFDCPVEKALKLIFKHIGDDPDREGLKETPKRIIKSWKELFAGYNQDKYEILNTTFKEYGDYDSIILLKDIDFMSFCEHHFLPFCGKAHVAYIPKNKGKVVGLSKLARLVDMHSKKLQIQEKMTCDITNDLTIVLDPVGAACVVEATHLCMSCRGIKKPNGKMITSSMKGVFLTEEPARNELMLLIRGN